MTKTAIFNSPISGYRISNWSKMSKNQKLFLRFFISTTFLSKLLFKLYYLSLIIGLKLSYFDINYFQNGYFERRKDKLDLCITKKINDFLRCFENV